MNLHEVAAQLKKIAESLQQTTKVLKESNEKQKAALAVLKNTQAQVDKNNEVLHAINGTSTKVASVPISAPKPPAFVHWSKKYGQA